MRRDEVSRRTALKLIAGAATAGTLELHSVSADGHQLATYRSKAMGCFMGAAIADAMGGPVECQHYKRIAKYFPDFQEHQPYDNPPATIFQLRPGYALDAAPGSVTDDTFIRMDLAKYVLESDPPYTAASFAPWLLENAEFSNWWKVAVRPLDRIKAGEVSAEDAGLNHKQGGGGGWWQPVAILYAGDPEKASAVAGDMCRIWKAPLERDILSSVVAGQSAAFFPNATVDTVVEAVLADSGPLARKLFTRAIEIASEAKDRFELYEDLYEHCLVKSCTTEVEGPMPERLPPVDKLDGGYNGILFAEQQPLALAYFVYGQGDPHKTVLTAVKGGRDADSVTCNSAAWLGALAGKDIWPEKWFETVQKANLHRMDLEQTAHDLIAKGLKNGTVALSRI